MMKIDREDTRIQGLEQKPPGTSRPVAARKATPGNIAIEVALTRAYTFIGPMRINGVVALDARMTSPSGRTVERKYRAFGSKTNMMDATCEYMDTLNYAMNSLLARVASDLKELCAAR